MILCEAATFPEDELLFSVCLDTFVLHFVLTARYKSLKIESLFISKLHDWHKFECKEDNVCGFVGNLSVMVEWTLIRLPCKRFFYKKPILHDDIDSFLITFQDVGKVKGGAGVFCCRNEIFIITHVIRLTSWFDFD